MIKNINLLPKEEKVRDVKGIIFNWLIVLAGIILIGTGLLTVLLFDIDKTLTSELAQYESINMTSKNYALKLRIYEEFESRVAYKSSLIEAIEKDEILWSKILYDIGKLIPEGAHISSFEGKGSELYAYLKEIQKGESKEGEKKISFVLRGESSDYIEILKLIIELKKINSVSDVWIKSINEIEIADYSIDASSFIINTYWNLDPFLENIQTNIVEDPEEGILDSEIEEIE